MADLPPEQQIAVLKRAVVQLTATKKELTTQVTSLEEKTATIAAELGRVNEHNSQLQSKNAALEAELEELKAAANRTIGSRLKGVTSIVPAFGWGGAAQAGTDAAGGQLPVPAAASTTPQKASAPPPELSEVQEALEKAQIAAFEQKADFEVQLEALRTSLKESEAQRAELVATLQSHGGAGDAGGPEGIRGAVASAEEVASLRQQLLRTEAERDAINRDGPFQRAAVAASAEHVLFRRQHRDWLQALNVDLAGGITSSDGTTKTWSGVQTTLNVVFGGLAAILQALLSSPSVPAAAREQLAVLAESHRQRSQAVHAYLVNLIGIQSDPVTTSNGTSGMAEVLDNLLNSVRRWLSTIIDSAGFLSAAIVSQMAMTPALEMQRTAAFLGKTLRDAAGSAVAAVNGTLSCLAAAPNAVARARTADRIAASPGIDNPRHKSNCRRVAALLDEIDSRLSQGPADPLRVALRNVAKELMRLTGLGARAVDGDNDEALLPPAGTPAPHKLYADTNTAGSQALHAAVQATAFLSKSRSGVRHLPPTEQQQRVVTPLPAADSTNNSFHDTAAAVDPHSTEIAALRLMLDAADRKAVDYYVQAQHLLLELEGRSQQVESLEAELDSTRQSATAALADHDATAESYEEQIRILSEKLAEIAPAAED